MNFIKNTCLSHKLKQFLLLVEEMLHDKSNLTTNMTFYVTEMTILLHKFFNSSIISKIPNNAKLQHYFTRKLLHK